MNLHAEQSRRHSLDHASFPCGHGIETRPGGQPTGPLEGVTSEHLDRVSTHQDTQVVLGLRKETVRIDQLKAAIALKRVQLVHVAVDQYGFLVAVRSLPPSGRDEGVLKARDKRGQALKPVFDTGSANLVAHGVRYFDHSRSLTSNTSHGTFARTLSSPTSHDSRVRGKSPTRRSVIRPAVRLPTTGTRRLAAPLAKYRSAVAAHIGMTSMSSAVQRETR